MTLILVRHVETDDNVDGELSGLRDVKISEEGKKQREKLISELKKKPVGSIHCGTLLRQIYTATPIKGLYPHEKYQEDPRLNEYNSGKFRDRSELVKFLLEGDGDILDKKPEGGETLREFQRRVGGFYDEVCRNHDGKNILVITSKGPIQIMMGISKNMDLLKALTEIKVEPAQIIEIN